MKDNDNFNATLLAATCALLGSAVPTPVAADEEAALQGQHGAVDQADLP